MVKGAAALATKTMAAGEIPIWNYYSTKDAYKESKSSPSSSFKRRQVH
jgi:hypothetical protein